MLPDRDLESEVLSRPLLQDGESANLGHPLVQDCELEFEVLGRPLVQDREQRPLFSLSP